MKNTDFYEFFGDSSFIDSVERKLSSTEEVIYEVESRNWSEPHIISIKRVENGSKYDYEVVDQTSGKKKTFDVSTGDEISWSKVKNNYMAASIVINDLETI